MSNENFQPSQDRIWKQYQFVFQDTHPVDEDVSASIREKIDSLQLQKEPLGIRYEKAGDEPLTVDIFIEEKVDKYYTNSLLKPREEQVFPPSSERSVKMQAFTPAEASTANDTSLVAVAADTMDGDVPANNDDPQVESITFRGAVRNPPPHSDTLP